jgi:hypothetical protein
VLGLSAQFFIACLPSKISAQVAPVQISARNDSFDFCLLRRKINAMAMIMLFLEWYYKEIPQKFYRIWKNYVWFWGYYFSLGDTLRTFFSPWKRIHDDSSYGFNIEKWLSALIWNLFSCLIGMVFRTFLIAILLLAELLTFAIGFLFLIVWPAFPLILIATFIRGLIYVI